MYLTLLSWALALVHEIEDKSSSLCCGRTAKAGDNQPHQLF